MITQPKIIFFCYSYIAGLVLAMIYPIDPRLLPFLHGTTTAAFILAISFYYWLVRRAHREAPLGPAVSVSKWQWLALLIPALALGYTRYIASNTVMDTRIAVVQLTPDGIVFRQDAPIPDTCRLRVNKTVPLDADLKLKLFGELDARIPVTDAAGVAMMDEQARWKFRIARMKQESEIITIGKDDPVGTDYVINQPFTRLVRVEVVEGPSQGEVNLYRISNHIGSFVRPGRNQAPVTILGHISADTLVYDFKTVLPVTPEFIQYPAGGPFYKVEGGDIHVTIKPELTNYKMFARTDAYGYDVEIRGELSVAGQESNIGGFNPRKSMQNYNVFGMMSVFQPQGTPTPIHAIAPAGKPLRHGNGLVEFSLDFRDRILRIFKLTYPYPQSAFMGGVTLGLRYGLQGTLCMFSDGQKIARGMMKAPPDYETQVHRDCEETIADEFKASGVNHVLAVSGLHVTIITVMFIGIFVILRLPKQVYTPLIILALVVFAIITGARPSVLRAVIMNSLFLLTWAYLEQGLRSSALLGVPVAAFLILLQNPLVVVDPSFTLSFGAILSLALLTGPAYEPLCKLRGNDFLFFLLIVIGTTLIGIYHWALLMTFSFLVPYLLMCAMVVWMGHTLEKKGIRLFGSIGYGDIPTGMGAFFAAQFAIQIGMMVPLSSYYFCRWPFAGAYANLIAIPLIGVVVQIGAIGGMLGIIPVVGNYIAVIMGASNWIFSSGFLWLAHASAAAYPYPVVRKPTISFLVVYYTFCGAFIWRKSIWAWLKKQCERFGYQGRTAPIAVFAGLLILGTWPVWIWQGPQKEPGLNITVLSVGYGSTILVETPQGKNILIDTGNVEHERSRKNIATRTTLPFLSYKGIRHLDGLILTSPRIERTAGASHLLDHAWVDHLYLPPSLMNLTPAVDRAEFDGRVAPGDTINQYDPQSIQSMYNDLVRNPLWPKRLSLAKSIQTRGDTFFNRWAGWVLQTHALTAGEVLFKEQTAAGVFQIEVLNPGDRVYANHPIENNSGVLRISYGNFAMLITSDLHFEGDRYLAETYSSDQLRADVFVVPARGTAVPVGSSFNIKASLQAALQQDMVPLLDKVKPQKAIFEFGNPKPVLGLASKDAINAYEITCQYFSDRLGKDSCLNSDRDLSIYIHSDGKGYNLRTQAELNRTTGGIEEPAEDTDIAW